MDATQAALTALYHHLSTDDTLQTTIGAHYQGPHHKPPKDTVWPYLTHKLDTLEGVDRATRAAAYQLHVWDYATDATRIWAIRARLMSLLDGSRHAVPDQGTMRLWHESDAWLPDEDTNVMHLTLSFTVRYARAGEVRAILTQKGT